MKSNKWTSGCNEQTCVSIAFVAHRVFLNACLPPAGARVFQKFSPALEHWFNAVLGFKLFSSGTYLTTRGQQHSHALSAAVCRKLKRNQRGPLKAQPRMKLITRNDSVMTGRALDNTSRKSMLSGHQGSTIARETWARTSLYAPPKPWEIDQKQRRRRARYHLIQAALKAPTVAEKGGLLESPRGTRTLGGKSANTKNRVSSSAHSDSETGERESPDETHSNFPVQRHPPMAVPLVKSPPPVEIGRLTTNLCHEPNMLIIRVLVSVAVTW